MLSDEDDEVAVVLPGQIGKQIWVRAADENRCEPGGRLVWWSGVTPRCERRCAASLTDRAYRRTNW